MKLDKSKIYYLAHPLTTGGRSIEENRKLERDSWWNLKKDYGDELCLVRPLDLIPRDWDEVDAWEACIDLLSICQGIILCPGWEESDGCCKEKNYASLNNLSVINYVSIIDTVESSFKNAYD